MMFALPAILDQQGIQDLVNPRYCPLDSSVLNPIVPSIPTEAKQDLVNYCEQNTTGFYDFAQAP